MSEPIQVPCAACGAANRLPRERAAERPACGRCKAPLFPETPPELDQERFAGYVQKSDLPVLVDCWAAWCGPCRAMAPQFAAAARAELGRVLFAKLDTDAAPGISASLGIRSIPTLILFRGGAEAARQSGALSAHQIAAWLRAQGV